MAERSVTWTDKDGDRGLLLESDARDPDIVAMFEIHDAESSRECAVYISRDEALRVIDFLTARCAR